MSNAVLLLIDLQKSVDHRDWGQRNNRDAEQKVAALLSHWRAMGWPIIHIRHDSVEPNSHYRPGQPGHDWKPEAMPLLHETVIGKQTNSAFIGTDLESRLRSAGWNKLIVCGVSTSNSVETTVRMAGNLGFDVQLVADACFTFGRKDWNGMWHDAETIHAISLANLDREYCSVVTSASLLP